MGTASKRKALRSQPTSAIVILAVLILLAIIGYKLSGTISGSQASTIGWICVSEFGDDTKGNGGCASNGNQPTGTDIPFRTIARAQQAATDLGYSQHNIAIEGPSYTLKEIAPIQVPDNVVMRIGQEPTSGARDVSLQGSLLQFIARGDLEIKGMNFTNLSSLHVTADGAGSSAEVLGNTFSDNSSSREFRFYSTNGGRVEITNNQINADLGRSITNHAIALQAQSNSQLIFSGNTIIQTHLGTPFRPENWLAVVDVNTNLPATQGHNYIIENNTFYTSANTISLDKVDKIWGFRVVTNGDPLADLEQDNNFLRFKGMPVKR